MAEAAAAAGVAIVTGDTKVVDRGAADGMYISTVRRRRHSRTVATCRRRRVVPGDVVLVSGTIADHGMAVMLARGDLALDADIVSDTAPLHDADGVPAGRRARRRAGCATRPAAGSARCATNSPATPTSPSCSTRSRCRCGPPVRGGVRAARASIRSTWRTRESSSPSSRADEADAALVALDGPSLRPRRRANRRDPRRTRPASSCSSHRSAALASSTCSSAIRCRASAEGGSLGRRIENVDPRPTSTAKHWTPVLDLRLAAGAPALGPLVGVVAGAFPAWRASAIEPVVALRSA